MNNLISQLLQLDPEKRLSAIDVLNHQIFSMMGSCYESAKIDGVQEFYNSDIKK